MALFIICVFNTAVLAGLMLVHLNLLRKHQNLHFDNRLHALIAEHLADRLHHSIKMNKTFVGILSKAEDEGRAHMVISEDALKLQFAILHYAETGESLHEPDLKVKA